MKLRRKFLITTVLSIGLVVITSTVFSAYILTGGNLNQTNNIEPVEVVVNDYRQNLLSYDTNFIDKLSCRDNDIVDDVFRLTLIFNNSEYTNRFLAAELRNLYLNSALKISVTFSNANLYNHLLNFGFYNFIDFSYQNTSNYLKQEVGEDYTYFSGANKITTNCLTYNNNSFELIIPISEERCASVDSSNQENYFLYKLQNDYGNAGISQRKFKINFNFNIVESFYGYSRAFTLTNIGKTTIKLSFEDLRKWKKEKV